MFRLDHVYVVLLMVLCKIGIQSYQAVVLTIMLWNVVIFARQLLISASRIHIAMTLFPRLLLYTHP